MHLIWCHVSLDNTTRREGSGFKWHSGSFRQDRGSHCLLWNPAHLVSTKTQQRSYTHTHTHTHKQTLLETDLHVSFCTYTYELTWNWDTLTRRYMQHKLCLSYVPGLWCKARSEVLLSICRSRASHVKPYITFQILAACPHELFKYLIAVLNLYKFPLQQSRVHSAVGLLPR